MKNKKTKKIIIIICVSVVGLLLILSLGAGIISLLGRVDTTNLTGKNDISFAPTDYDENIFEDEKYASKNHNVFFEYDGYAEYITAENYLTFSVGGQLFYNYFDCVINGNYSHYPSFFSDSFLSSSVLPERFTMQKLYDISVTLESRESYKEGYLETYSIRYRIIDNNGTFRSDLENNTVIPLIYTVYVTDAYAEITGISVLGAK